MRTTHLAITASILVASRMTLATPAAAGPPSPTSASPTPPASQDPAPPAATSPQRGWAPPPGQARHPYPYAYPPYPYPYPYPYPPPRWSPHDAPPPDLPTPVKERYWYGWQTLITYFSSVAVLAITPAGGGGAAVVTLPLGVGGMVFGGPIVHWAHGNVGKGFGSLGINLGATAVGGAIGAGLACGGGGCKGDFGGFGIAIGLGVGGAVGSLTGMIIDVAALSYGERARRPPGDGRRARPFVAAPLIHFDGQRGVLGLSGAF